MQNNILSLDGGGTRGYGQIVFLENFPTLINKADYFVGVSVGALNAVALAFGLSPTILKDFYIQKSPWIFTIRSVTDVLSNDAGYPSNRPSLLEKGYMILREEPFYLAVSTESNYGDTLLKREIQNIFGETKISDLKKRVAILSFSLTQNLPVLFTNIDITLPNFIIKKDITITDAVMASMSAPFYFPPTQIQLNPDTEQPKDYLIDGGVVSNTPHSLGLLVSALQNNKRNCVCSLSTGKSAPDFSGVQQIGLSFILSLLEITLNSYYDSKFFKTLSDIGYSPFFFYRLDYNLPPEYSDLDCTTSDFFQMLNNKIQQKMIEDEQEINSFLSRWEDKKGMGLEDE